MNRFQSPKGCADLLGADARAWRVMCDAASEVFSRYGYDFAATPVFENEELFVRSAGEGTDVAGKEMFAVRSSGALSALEEGRSLKADQRLALRPEGTAGIVRAIVEHGLVAPGSPPVRLWYAGSMFRCERPQKGRLREFRQIGAECLGATSAVSDAEMIVMLMRFFSRLGLTADSMTLLVNSMGCPECRPAFERAVSDYLLAHADGLCEDCRRRAADNPLRAFDCKREGCRSVIEGAPKFADHLCERCAERFETVKGCLESAGVAYREDGRLVRGFDYYTGTVFEVQVDSGLGSQNAIGGGGRYDGLTGELGGPDVCGLGFAVGFERIMLALRAAGVELGADAPAGTYLVCAGEECRSVVFDIATRLRDAGVTVLVDTQGRSVKSQMKAADKSGCARVAVIGPDELESGTVTVRDMATHAERRVPVDTLAAELL